MTFKHDYEVSKEDARNRLVTEIMQIVRQAEKKAEAAHTRHDTQLRELVLMRQEIGRLGKVVESQSDMIVELQESIVKIREWAKTKKLS